MLNKIIHGDCLEVMKQIPDDSIDMVLCDLPYGTTQCKWDSVIPFAPLWEQYDRICKGACVFTASQPFTSKLVLSHPSFKYALVYEKSHAVGHLNANKMPMKKHEDVLVFYTSRPTYNPQKQPKKKENIRPNKKRATRTDCYGVFDPNANRTDGIDVSFPTSMVFFNNSTTGGDRGLHPTQKPIALFEYLIRTYTNEGDTVLDNCIGSGTTAIACINTNRNYIGIEKEEKYWKIAEERVKAHLPTNAMRFVPGVPALSQTAPNGSASHS